MKKKLWILWILIVALGVCGCMMDGTKPNSGDTGLEQVEQELLQYLNEKYDETFEMVSLVHEYNGDTACYRGVFRCGSRPEAGVVLCYEEAHEGLPQVRIAGDECWISDDYAAVILQDRYAAGLQELLGGEVLVKCRIETPNRMLTDEQLQAGPAACLEDDGLESMVFVYVFAEGGQADAALKAAAEQYLSGVNAFRQYLYVVYQPGVDPEQWAGAYGEHYDNFEHYLLNDSQAKLLDFSSFARDEGVVKRTLIER